MHSTAAESSSPILDLGSASKCGTGGSDCEPQATTVLQIKPKLVRDLSLLNAMHSSTSAGNKDNDGTDLYCTSELRY